MKGGLVLNGGKRKGAGRPKGSVSKANEEARRRAAETGELPLDYMLRIMRDNRTKPVRRDTMAMAAAPYLHARLSSVQVDTTVSGTLRIIDESMSPQEAAQAYSEMLKAQSPPMIDVTPQQEALPRPQLKVVSK